jgi:hypothetical protein
MVLALVLGANNFIKYTQNMNKRVRACRRHRLSFSETGRFRRASRRAARNPAVAALVAVTALVIAAAAHARVEVAPRRLAH